MKLTGLVLAYVVDEGDSLKPLVDLCGYSQPVKSERGMITGKVYQGVTVELERIKDSVFISIKADSDAAILGTVKPVLADLRKEGVGLIA
jgi:hypothetical protein